ncbi:Yip1 family protein [soil metagenome]
MGSVKNATNRGAPGMDWRKLVSQSLIQPRAAARSLMALGLPLGLLVQAAAAVTALAILLSYLALAATPDGVDAVSRAIVESPLIGAAIQFGVILVVGYFTFYIGRLFGGTGNLGAALALVVWLNAMLLFIQIVQLAILFVVPPLASLVAVVTVFWALWAFANFVTELHGFQNALLVLGGVLLSMFVLFFGLAMVLAVLGLGPEG